MAQAERQVQVRTNPLPAGRYWIDVFGVENVKDFGAWVTEMAGAVRTEQVEENPEADPPSLFAIFVVPDGRSPFMPFEKFGFPTTAPASVKSKDDTEHGPDDEDESSDFGKAVKVLAVVGVALAATVGVYLLVAWTEGKKARLLAEGPVSGTRVREKQEAA
jgi:hypothetical protein